MARTVLKLALGVALFVACAQAGTVALAWWRGELAQPTVGEWLWIAALPVLVGAYLRFFSVLRPGCDACAAAEPPRTPGPRGP